MSRFLRFCAFLSVLFFTTNVFANGYVCPSYKQYTRCNSGYYMTANVNSTTHDATIQPGNACRPCSVAGSNCTCEGGTDAPVCTQAGSTTITDASTLVISSSGAVVYPNNKTLTVTCSGGVNPNNATSSNTSVATVSRSGNTITLVPTGTGSATITVSCPASGSYTASSASYILTVYPGLMAIGLPTSSETNLTYNGSAQVCGKVTATAGTTAATVTYGTSSGSYTSTSPITKTDAGTYTIYYQATAYGYQTRTGSFTCTIDKAANPITLSASSGTVAYPNSGTFTVSNAQGTLSVASSATGVATASVSGTTVTMTSMSKVGSATITVTAAGNANYYSGSKTYTLTVNCSAGYYSASGTCTVCAAGTYTSSANTAASCTNVNNGCYADTTGSSVACPKSCPTLTDGYSYVSGTGWDAYSDCKETKAYSSVSANCYGGVLTKTATSATAWGAAVSTLTAKGGYKVSGSGDSTTCSVCGYGSYSSNGNDTTCDACPTATSGWTMTTTSNTATGYSACYQYQTPTNCASGSVKKVASSATAWGSDVSVHSALSSKPGYYVSGTSCTVCGNGTFYGGGTATSCTSCPAETNGYNYVPGTGWVAYSDCKETKAYSSVSANCYSGALTKTATSATAWGAAVSTLTGKAGSGVVGSGDSTTCSPCGAGKWSAEGSAVCANIDAGCYGTSSGLACPAKCAKGTYSTGGASVCTTADSGYYVDTEGASEQTQCPSTASGSDNGRDAKGDCYVNCSAKTINNGTTTVVNNKEYHNGTSYPACTFNVNCNATYGASGNKTSNPACTLCSGGQWSSGGTLACQSCPSGYDDGAVGIQESDCKISVSCGKYVGTKNSATLSNCASGYYKTAHTVNYGSTSACSQVTGANYTADACTVSECPSGYTADTTNGKTSATQCKISVDCGKYVGTKNSATLSNCASGYYKTAHTVNYGSTSACSQVTGANYTADACTVSECPSGYTADTTNGKTSASQCKISVAGGKYVGTKNSATLSTCDCGTYKAAHMVNYGSTSSCATTAAGYYAAAGASAQTQADAGYYAAAGACSQTKVNAGCYTTGKGSSVVCPNSCANLGGGLYKNSQAGSDAETDCYVTTTAGKYINANTDTTQTTCPEKSYCPATTLNYPNAGGRKDCPDPTNSTYQQTLSQMSWLADHCPDATASNSTITTAWTWQGWSNTGLSSITQCVARLGVATPCTGFNIDGVYYDETKGVYDTNAANIYTSGVKSGYYLHTKYSESYCTIDGATMVYRKAAKCPAGSYCPGGTVPSCSSGSYNDSWGATACALGAYSTTGQSACTACQNGKTTSGTGKTSCDADCSNASGVNAWETASWTANSVSNLCTIAASAGCGANYYKTSNSCATCSSGTSGKYTLSGVGTTSVNSCYLKTDAGKYVATKGAGQTACISPYYCEGGSTIYYGAGTTTGGNSACTDLGAIYTASDASASKNTQCFATTSKTKWVASAKATTESTCPAGSFCVGGAKVYYNSTGGSEQCPAGYRDGTTGYGAQSQCLMNVAGGKYVATPNESSASGICAKGYAKAPHAVTYGTTSSCDACTGATYADNTNQSSCTTCPTATNGTNVAGYGYYNTGNDGDHTERSGCYATFKATTLSDGSLAAYSCYVDTNNNYYGADGSSKLCWVNRPHLTCSGGYYNSAFNANSSTYQDGSYKTVNALLEDVCIPVTAGYWSANDALDRAACDPGLTTIGYGTGANEAADCGRKLHAGDNIIYLRSAARTTPALNVKVDDKTFYGALSTSLSGALKVKNGSTEYSVVNDYQ